MVAQTKKLMIMDFLDQVLPKFPEEVLITSLVCIIAEAEKESAELATYETTVEA